MADTSKSKKIIEGKLMPYYETGMEGTMWALHEDGQEGYDGLNKLENGQLLTVFNDAARTDILWQGVIDFEMDSDKQKQIFKAHKYHAGLGGWRFGVQKDIHPYDWIEMFYSEKPARIEPFRAIIK